MIPPEAILMLFAVPSAPIFSVVLATTVADVRLVSPAIVDAVAPKATAVEPIVRLELANCEFGIALVPISPVPLS